jgi:hypothetical protein
LWRFEKFWLIYLQVRIAQAHGGSGSVSVDSANTETIFKVTLSRFPKN